MAIGATVLNGLLAGLNFDRGMVQMPAWRRVGVRAWATYSRHADLGNGLLLYPGEAIGGAVLSVAVAVALRLDRRFDSGALVPASIAALLAIGGLMATTKAAPEMLSLRTAGDDLQRLESAFTGFSRWGSIRAVCQILAFGANLWALVAVTAR